MESENLQKRIYAFIAVIASVALVLILLPFLQELIFQNIYSQLNLEIDPDDDQVMSTDGTEPSQAATITLGLIANLFRVLKIILWMTIVIAFVRLTLAVIFGAALKKSSQYEISSLLKTVLSVIVYIVAFFIIFQTQYPNVPLAPLFTGSTILGIVVGLALQDTLGNLFSGIAIQADQSFQVGDIVAITNQGIGTVESVSWRGVKIRTFQNKLLVISNSVIGKETVEVAQKDNLNARLVFFNTLYTNSPAKVIHVVREAVRQVENVSPKRRPKVRIRDLGDNGIDWEVKYWTLNYRRFNDTDALIRQRIWYAFQREDLDFAYPTRTIYTAKQSEEEDVFVETADEICERIANTSIFAPLPNDEITRIGESCSVRVFAPEEPIVQVGQKDKSMFVINRGMVRIQVLEDGVAHTINTLEAGDFFGEMSLFTGEPRTADVVADTETQVLEIKPHILKPILEKNPELARIIGEIIDDRREKLTQKEEETKLMTDAETKGVLKSIKRFFGLNS
ncbi:MAG: mechanosensitive ion channel [Pyrinomonadaceae bacterium]|nr:mechanosensitive ion channel [Pyrinomonadaceae bacterium]